MIGLISILIPLCFYLSYGTYLYFSNKTIREYTRVCLDIDNSAFNLFDYLFMVLHHSETKEKTRCLPHADKLFTIERQYWLKKDDDKKIVEAILTEYKKCTCENFFKNIFRASTSKKTEAEYFLITLYDFLTYEHKEERIYNSICDTVSKDHFWVVFYKIKLICRVYLLAMRNDPYNNTTVNYNEMLKLKEFIEEYQSNMMKEQYE